MHCLLLNIKPYLLISLTVCCCSWHHVVSVICLHNYIFINNRLNNELLPEKHGCIIASLSARPEEQLTRMAEPIPLPVNPSRTHSRLSHHPVLRTDGR